MSNTYLTLNEVTDLVGFPLSSVKRYLEVHSEHLDHYKKHNRFFIHVSAVDTLRLIRGLYGQGLRFDDVVKSLNNEDIPVVITVPNEEDYAVINLNEEMKAIKEMLKYQSMQFEKLQESNQQIQEELLNLKQDSTRRDSELIKELKDTLEEKKRGFFSKLFGIK